MVELERLDESGRLGEDRPIETLEGNLNRARLHARLGQQRFQRHAFPSRVAHRPVGDLAAGDPRLKKAAAVARALIDRNQLDRLEAGFQLREATATTGVSTLP